MIFLQSLPPSELDTHCSKGTATLKQFLWCFPKRGWESDPANLGWCPGFWRFASQHGLPASLGGDR